MTVAYLELILGPMFSGKTTQLVNKYNDYIQTNMNVLAINYSADKRYHDTMLSTHDQQMIPCIFAENLLEPAILSEMMAADVLLINEGQFFSDIYEAVAAMLGQGKRIHVCGLDGDFRQKTFGKLLSLIPLCDVVVKLNAICHDCDGQAIFSYRLSNETEQVVIGTTNYVPLCRSCLNDRQPEVVTGSVVHMV